MGRRVCWVVLGLALVALPFLLEKGLSQYYLYLFLKIMVWALFAMSFNLVLGYGGMMSFGHAAFFGIGAYACSLMLVKAALPFLPAFLAAPVGAAIGGLIIGFFCVRIRGIFYFAVITLSFAQLVYILIFKWRSLTLGDDGLQGIAAPTLIAPEGTYVRFYFFALIVCLICVFLLWRIIRSPFGMILRSLKDNPERSSFIGVPVNQYRLAAFTISALFSGVAGALYALLETSVAPNLLFWSMSGEVILMGLIGGAHLFLGPALGAAIMVLLNTYITAYTTHWSFFLGVILVLIVLFFPRGIGGLAVDYFQQHKKRPIPMEGKFAG
jgi:branched-chain amino acid transport system permease protein